MTDTQTTMTKTPMTNGVRVARWAWVIAAGTTVALVIRRLGSIWTEAGSIGPAPETFNAEGQYRLSSAQARALSDIGLSPDWHAALVTTRFVLVAMTALTIGYLVWRRATTWAPLFLAWFLLASMLMTALTESLDDVPALLTIPILVLVGGGAISMVGLLVVFPDDRSARWFVPLILAAAGIPLYASATNNDAVGDWIWENGLYVFAVIAVLGVALQAARVIHSRDRTARDLLLLSVGAIALIATLGTATDHPAITQGSRDGLGSLAQRLGYETLLMAVPIVYGLAVLWILVRRGDWDMDVQLKGSVGYAGLTTILVLGYFGIVAVVQAIVNDVSGASGNTFALMVSTAVIAALFLPARAGLQRLVDRVFDRRRRDAERRVEAFEEGIMRESRPDEVAGALIGVVDDVVRPEHAELWLVGGTES